MEVSDRRSITDGNPMNEGPTAAALPCGIAGESPGPASLVASDISRERWAPLIEKIRLAGMTAQRIIDVLSHFLNGDAWTPGFKANHESGHARSLWLTNPWLALWRGACGPFFVLHPAAANL